jgi:hypothetical protein
MIRSFGSASGAASRGRVDPAEGRRTLRRHAFMSRLLMRDASECSDDESPLRA